MGEGEWQWREGGVVVGRGGSGSGERGEWQWREGGEGEWQWGEEGVN